jgi:hypothetical protein
MSRSFFLVFLMFLPLALGPPSFWMSFFVFITGLVPYHPSRAIVGPNTMSLVLDVGCYFHSMVWHITKGIVTHFMLFQHGVPSHFNCPFGFLSTSDCAGLVFGFGPFRHFSFKSSLAHLYVCILFAF